ncbi:MAG: hypothetical protein ACRDNM_08515, partial [Gaiellaceae bacterium]
MSQRSIGAPVFPENPIEPLPTLDELDVEDDEEEEEDEESEGDGEEPELEDALLGGAEPGSAGTEVVGVAAGAD